MSQLESLHRSELVTVATPSSCRVFTTLYVIVVCMPVNVCVGLNYSVVGDCGDSLCWNCEDSLCVRIPRNPTS